MLCITGPKTGKQCDAEQNCGPVSDVYSQLWSEGGGVKLIICGHTVNGERGSQVSSCLSDGLSPEGRLCRARYRRRA
jgi:hypothetical protein